MPLIPASKFWPAGLLLALAVSPVASCNNGMVPISFACESVLPFAISTPVGDVRCADGLVHRGAGDVVECPIPNRALCPSDANGSGGASMGTGGASQCATDAECKDGPNGVCQNLNPGCVCNYACTNDAECGPGKACMCDGGVGVCVVASCRTDAECNGSICVFEPVLVNSWIPLRVELACLSPADSCVTDATCGTDRRCGRVGTHLACVPAPIAPSSGPKE